MRVITVTSRWRHWSLVVLLLVLALSGLAAAEAIERNLLAVTVHESWAQMFGQGAYPACPQTVAPAQAPTLRANSTPDQMSVTFGRYLWVSGSCEEAVELWRRCVVRDPYDAICALGLLHGGAVGDIPSQLRRPLAHYASLRAQESLQGADPGTAQRWEQGARALWQVLANSTPPDDPQKWWAEGQVAETDEAWQQAAAAYGRGAALAGDPYDFWMRQGHAYEQALDLDLASAAYRNASQARPQSGAPNLALGTIARHAQRYDEAITWYLRAAAVMPGYVEPLGQIGYTYYLWGRYAEARPYFESVLARSPNEARIAYYLAQVLMLENDPAGALRRLEQAIAASSDQPWTWAELLGDWRQAQGDRQGSLEAYEMALRWNTGDATALQLKIDALKAGRNGGGRQ